MAPKKSEEIKRMLLIWTELQVFIERYHKDKIESASLIDGVNERIMNQFRMTLFRRKQQVSFTRYFSPKAKESEATPEVVDLPALDMETE